jgi:hypothetical protein
VPRPSSRKVNSRWIPALFCDCRSGKRRDGNSLDI